MFKKSRKAYESYLKKESNLVGYGSFVCSGVDCTYTIESGAYDGVTVCVRYRREDVPWLDRDGFQRKAENLVRGWLKEYYIKYVFFDAEN